MPCCSWKCRAKYENISDKKLHELLYPDKPLCPLPGWHIRTCTQCVACCIERVTHTACSRAASVCSLQWPLLRACVHSCIRGCWKADGHKGNCTSTSEQFNEAAPAVQTTPVPYDDPLGLRRAAAAKAADAPAAPAASSMQQQQPQPPQPPQGPECIVSSCWGTQRGSAAPHTKGDHSCI